jgi:hypothetical protein
MLGMLGRIALAMAVTAPLAARADLRLLDDDLRPPNLRSIALVRLAAAEQPAPKDGKAPAEAQPPAATKPPAEGKSPDAAKPKEPAKPSGSDAATGLDFDLLGEGKAPAMPPEDKTMKKRRKMLGIHQTMGIGLFGLQVATTVVGQLNYNDKFGDSNTGKYKTSHQVLAYSTLAAFAATGAIALLAPDAPSKPDRGFDRVSLHKLSMFTAAAGMAAQVALGLYTASREGYENKQDYGRAHLVVGYATLAAMVTGVSAIVF